MQITCPRIKKRVDPTTGPRSNAWRVQRKEERLNGGEHQSGGNLSERVHEAGAEGPGGRPGVDHLHLHRRHGRRWGRSSMAMLDEGGVLVNASSLSLLSCFFCLVATRAWRGLLIPSHNPSPFWRLDRKCGSNAITSNHQQKTV